MPDTKPAYTHDCNRCVYLGTHNHADMYLCPPVAGDKFGSTVIIRYSSEPADNRSVAFHTLAGMLNNRDDYRAWLALFIQFLADNGALVGLGAPEESLPDAVSEALDEYLTAHERYTGALAALPEGYAPRYTNRDDPGDAEYMHARDEWYRVLEVRRDLERAVGLCLLPPIPALPPIELPEVMTQPTQ